MTFNYRLGVLGFLCLGTGAASGNAGLKDLIAALYWIQKNITKFGGNPLDVTVHGTGAGAAAVELVVLSGLTVGLLHKVILESGSALSPTSLTYNPIADAIKGAKTLGFKGSEDDLDQLVQFYYQTDADKLGNIDQIFLPCIEKNRNGLLEMEPRDILRIGNFQKVPILIAYTNILEVTNDDIKILNYEPVNFEELLPNNLNFGNDRVKFKVGELVRDYYFVENRHGDSLVRSYLDYFHDITVEYPVTKGAILHAAASPLPVYLMKFTLQNNVDSRLERMPGIDDDIILRYLYAIDNLEKADELAVSKLVAIWTNFIKMG